MDAERKKASTEVGREGPPAKRKRIKRSVQQKENVDRYTMLCASVSSQSVAGVTENAARVFENFFLDWNEALNESQSFESFCPVRVEQLIKEARVLEKHLREKKERLKAQLRKISRTLASQ